MKLVVAYDDNVVQLDVYEDMELETLTAYCEAEMGTSFGNLVFVFNTRPLLEVKKTLKQCGVQDGDMLLVVNKSMLTTEANQTSQPHAQPSVRQNASLSGASSSGNRPNPLEFTEITMDQAARVRESFLTNSSELATLKENNPPLAEAVTNGTLENFHKILSEQHKQSCEARARRLRMMTADPFDVEAQKMIAEEIRREQIESNMRTAIEFSPEVFGQVHMLYIECKVNGTPIKAFVDSGAQSTIMSKSCADRCNVTRLIDSRWEGVALGVGTQKIVGRIHLCQLQIGNDFLPSSFSVLEEQPMDMLLGLDILKRHQCVIDLAKNILIIGTTGTETRFLDEAELPPSARAPEAPANQKK